MNRLFEDIDAYTAAEAGEEPVLPVYTKRISVEAAQAIFPNTVEPPRTERGRRLQAMAEWKAREPTAEDLKDFCPHGSYLPIETCEEGCEQ